MIGVAVKLTEVPEHIGFAEEVIETLAGRFGFIAIVISLDVAGLPVAQVRFEVRVTLILSPDEGI